MAWLYAGAWRKRGQDCCREYTGDARRQDGVCKSFGIKAYACYPLMQPKQGIGHYLSAQETRINFSDDDLDMMKAVADQVAIPWSRVRSEDNSSR